MAWPPEMGIQKRIFSEVLFNFRESRMRSASDVFGGSERRHRRRLHSAIPRLITEPARTAASLPFPHSARRAVTASRTL
jgi:hypothetical protein